MDIYTVDGSWRTYKKRTGFLAPAVSASPMLTAADSKRMRWKDKVKGVAGFKISLMKLIVLSLYGLQSAEVDGASIAGSDDKVGGLN